jgi:hypothetical protein
MSKGPMNALSQHDDFMFLNNANNKYICQPKIIPALYGIHTAPPLIGMMKLSLSNNYTQIVINKVILDK